MSAVLRCESCGGETWEPLIEPGFFRCHNCGSPGAVKLAVVASGGGGAVGSGVWMVSCGPKKIQVIKVLRTYLQLDLKAAKTITDLADRSPQALVGSGIDAASMDRMASELVAAGAQIRRNP
jgi:ribosomal protein L7/L12